jgi:hypothetical protein
MQVIEPVMSQAPVEPPVPVVPPSSPEGRVPPSPPPPPPAPNAPAHWVPHMDCSHVPNAVSAIAHGELTALKHLPVHVLSLHAQAALQVVNDPQSPPERSPDVYPDPNAVVSSDEQLALRHETQDWFAAELGSWSAQANFVAELLLELLHATTEAAQASASAVRARNPIMKEPPGEMDGRWTPCPRRYSPGSPERGPSA